MEKRFPNPLEKTMVFKALTDLLFRHTVRRRGAPIQADLVYDLGLNTGQDAEFYLKKGFRVVGVEANPAIADAARKRLRSFGSRLHIVRQGVGSKKGVVPFYVNRRHHEQSTFLKEYTTGPLWDLGYDEIKAKVDTIHPILNRFGVPYYMKIDIEALDLAVLTQLAEIEARPKYISVETGPTLAWIEALEALGYDRFKLVNQASNKDQKPPYPAREGNYVEHIFEWGSSGLFGDEVPGDWISGDAMRMVWRGHIEADFPEGRWFDIHATRN